MLVIIDYGVSNLRSVLNACRYLGQEPRIVHDANELSDATKVILPGVGSYASAIDRLQNSGFDQEICSLAEKGIPILGICLGMQLLGTESTEDGMRKGLGLIQNPVEKFSAEVSGLKIPHVGFNTVEYPKQSALFYGLPDKPDFYFTHSYRMIDMDKGASVSTTVYGDRFVSAFEKENVMGTQFHPEKSQNNGLVLLRNFFDKF